MENTSPPEGPALDDPFVEGEALLQAGDRARALSAFRAALVRDAKNARAWLGVARSTDDGDEANEALARAIELDPDNVEARNLRLGLQVRNLRESVPGAMKEYRENLIERFGRPALAVLAIALVAALVIFGRDPAALWLSQRFASAQVIVPTLSAAALPPTWTPIPTSTNTLTPVPSSTPIPSATPNVVRGRINGTVNTRSGPGAVFAVLGSLNEPTEVVLTARDRDNQYYQVASDSSGKPVWVSRAFVNIISGDPAILPVLDVPTPTATRPPPPPRVIVPPTAAPVRLFQQSKNVSNPFGPRCDRTYIHGTVWNDAHLEPQGGIAGILIRLWVNNKEYKTDRTGSHSVPSTTPGYWEVYFTTGQPISGLAAVVAPDGQLLSAQYPFTMTSGECSNPSTVNEIIMDFERIH